MTSQDRLFFSDCVLRGGMGSISTDDFDQIGCLFPRGGPGLDTAGSAFVLDSTLSGGPGHPSFGAFCSGCNCNTGIDGPAFLGTPTFLPGKAQRATTSPAIREGGSLSIRVEGPPHVPVWFAASLAPRSTRHIGDLRGFVLLDLSSSPPLFFMGVTDAAGVLEKTVPFADLPAGIESSTTFFQFMYMESPMLPGGFKILRQPREEKVLVLGQGSMIVGLDEAF
jgi:hypothetical protein